MTKRGYKHTQEAKGSMSKAMKGKYIGDKHPNWKGGRLKRKVRKNSYNWTIYKPDHPRANGKYVLEHILIAEQMLGRPLEYHGHNHPDNEVVHHINMDGLDNRPENLFVVHKKEHTLIHQSLTAILFNMATDLINKNVIELDKERMKYFFKNKKEVK